MKVACYCRVSTNKESQLESYENQVEYFNKLLENHPTYELYRIYTDKGISAKSMKKRPGLLQMLEDARKGLFKTILVKDITRFSRNTVDFLTTIRELKEKDINIIFVNYNQETIKEDDELNLTMQIGFAQSEIAKLSKKVKFGKDINAKKGRVPNFCFGYNKVDTFTLEINQKESEVVKKIFDLFVNKKYGTGKIADYLNTNNILTKKMKVANWYQKTVIDILRNPIYTGKIINKKTEVVDYLTGRRRVLDESQRIVVEKPEIRIIDDATFYKAQNMLRDKSDSFNLRNKRESTKHVFSNLIKCSECGYSFRRCKRKYSEKGKEYVWWTCSQRNAKGVNACSNKITIDEGELIQLIKERLLLIEENRSKLIKNVSREVKNILKEQNAQEMRSKSEVLKDIENIKEEIRHYISLERNNIINMDMLKEETAPLNKQLEKLNLELFQINNHVNIELDVEKAVRTYFSKAKSLTNIEFTNQDLKQVIDKIEAYPDGSVEISLLVSPQHDISIPLSYLNTTKEN